jgi:cation/acetate symporter
MIHEASWLAIAVFGLFVAVTLGLSFYLGSRAKSAQGYFAAHGQIHWAVNGIAFAGDYLSAASFLGICGMIAFYGYDGFLYSIGYLAGWVVALFVIAEPMKRLGKFTFADALDATFASRGIKAAAGISTLVVSVFYLIPQMVGAGALIQPLLNLDHWVGVVLVGATVMLIVVSAGMVSTTYVQFLKGSLLVIFSGVLTILLWQRGFQVSEGGIDGHLFQSTPAVARTDQAMQKAVRDLPGWHSATLVPPSGDWAASDFVQFDQQGVVRVFRIRSAGSDRVTLHESQTVAKGPRGEKLVNGLPLGKKKGDPELHPVGFLSKLPGDKIASGPVGPLSFFSTLQRSEVVLWPSQKVKDAQGVETVVYYSRPTPGSRLLRPGEYFTGLRSNLFSDKLNFLSLMLALFCGTASLPHILIRYYTVKDGASARKSTIVGIASIGCFYILTLYMGLGAMTSGALDPTNSNMAAPLLAKSMSQWLFAVISAIAFTTVLGTVSGLILASAGAVTHDLLSGCLGWQMTDHEKVRVAKMASVVVGLIAIVLGILFEKMNVSYLVGWAFSVAASANLPSLVMLLFWKQTTKMGIITAVVVGMVTSLGWILLSADTFTNVYGLSKEAAWVPFSQPGIVTIPLGFITLIVVSLLTRTQGSGTATP